MDFEFELPIPDGYRLTDVRLTNFRPDADGFGLLADLEYEYELDVAVNTSR